ncbi:MAG: AAA family ATPase [Deltaproteobacteria bacterium]|nr:AAA family ATPase [Deltaproteobacteria bacterium]
MGGALQLLESQVADAKDRIRRVFQFIKARAEVVNPVGRVIEDRAWKLILDDLPAHPSVSIGHDISGSDDGADFVLSIRRPKETACPPPPPLIADWLVPGWERPELPAPETLATRNPTIGGRAIVEAFDAELQRAATFAKWAQSRKVWALAEAPVREAISAYERLFALRAQLQRAGEDFRLLLGEGWLVWQHAGGLVEHPLLLHELELDFNETAPALTLRASRPTPELHAALLRLLPEVDGRAVASASELVERPEVWLLAGGATREIATGVANTLFSKADVLERTSRPAPRDEPFIALGPIVFLAPRSGAVQRAADRFVESLDAMTDLPAPLVRVVIDVENANAKPREEGGNRVDPLFTLPANPEQEEIIQRLARDGAVVVQGPPGTGKTHTIANLIGHLLAEGKTILVTSHTTKALRVLRDKVVPQLRPLCVNFSESDLRGREQLESSVNGIVSRLSLPSFGADGDVERLREGRLHLKEALAAAEHELDLARRTEIDPIVIDGRQWRPGDAADLVRNATGVDDWIDEPAAQAMLPLTRAEVVELYGTQQVVLPKDEKELAYEAPSIDAVPSSRALAELLSQLDRAEKGPWREAARFWGTSVAADGEVAAAHERARDEISWLTDEAWLHRCLADRARGAEYAQAWDDLAHALDEAAQAMADWYPHRMRHEVVIDGLDDDASGPCTEMIEHIRGGGSFGWLTLMRHPLWKAVQATATVDGRAPATADELEVILAALQARRCQRELRRRWQRQLAPLAAPELPESLDRWPDFIAQFSDLIGRAAIWFRERWAPAEAELRRVGLEWDQVLAETTAAGVDGYALRIAEGVRAVLPRVLEARRAAAERNRVSTTERQLVASLQAWSKGSVGAALYAAVRGRDVGAYERAIGALGEWHRLHGVARRRAQLLARLATAAPLWAAAIRTRAPPHQGPKPPGDAEAAWLVARLRREIDARSRVDLDGLQQRVAALQKEVERRTADLVERMAWKRQKQRVTQPLLRKLNGWVDHQKQIGKGTGKRAARLQRAAQGLLSECRDAVPVWIMPLARVIESYDMAKTRFDVVIIDEASQCEVEGLFAFALARELVVVGDDQQVSPYGVGENIEVNDKLIDQHLAGIPNKELFTGQLSIYDVGKQSQHAIRLREHFRCVPEIIAFSNKLAYDGEIQPLRSNAGVRTRPHVVEHCVAGGTCDDDNVNAPEAIEIVSLMMSCAEQREYEHATMGVISLLGDRQWELIEQLVHRLISARDIERRRIVCGNSGHFQGDERSVMFLSMVWSSEGKPQKKLQDSKFKKRLNVAASRAQDQMWVVHSLDANVDLQEGDLRLGLLRHARNPRALLDDLRGVNRTESPFEAGVLKLLQARNYRVHPQRPVGAFRLDLVVEGSEGEVAIECDGDRHHSAPDKVRADRQRQQQLERLGWRFIRVRGSAYFRDPTKAIDHVVQRLEALGIDPIGPQDDVDDAIRDREAAELHARILRRASELRAQVHAAWEETRLAKHSTRRGWGRAAERTAQDNGESVVPASKPPPKTAIHIAMNAPAVRPSRTRLPQPVGEPSRLAQQLLVDLPSASLAPASSDAPLRPPTVGVAAARMNGVAPQVLPRQLICRELVRREPVLSDLRCHVCGGPTKLEAVAARAPNKGGIVVLCVKPGCPVGQSLVDVKALQRLADHLGIKCFRCNGDVESRGASFGTFLVCRSCDTKSYWHNINEKLENEARQKK